MKAPTPPSGHRLLSHMAYVIIEAWGLSRESCLREAVRGLVEVFADVRGIRPCAGHWRCQVTVDV